MRLLNTQTLQLEFFATENKPEYAILSHTWGSEEVLFEDARNGKGSLLKCKKNGLGKVLKSAEVAAQNGYQYIWIDACCIDKSSSAELSEAINSMFAWYQRSAVCYAFLSDYQARDGELSEARWFTRGWTLQELIAPPEVHFYDSAWTRFGDRRSLSSQITAITGIDEGLLRRKQSYCVFHRALPGSYQPGCEDCLYGAVTLTRRLLGSYSISTKMSWAARRETTRVEDIAYCLLGIFDVAMPLLYGEGLKAFRRLQEGIVRHSDDQTFLAWQHQTRQVSRNDGVFAAHPVRFSNGHRFRAVPSLLSEFAATTVWDGGGVELDVHLAPCNVHSCDISYQEDAHLAVLNCSEVDDDFCCVSILLEETYAAAPRSFRRLRGWGGQYFPPILVSPAIGIRPLAAPDYFSPFRVESDLSRMVRSRILLHGTKNEWSTSDPIDCRAVFTFPGQLIPGYRVRRQVPDPTALTWENTGLPEPFNMSRPSPFPPFIRLSLFVYGAASISGGKCEFSIIWGIVRTTRSWLVRPPPSDTNDENEAPFCKVFQNLWTAQETDGLDTTDWVARALKSVRFMLKEERDTSPAVTDPQPLGAFSSLTCVTDSGSICIEATIKANEFLGRKRFDVEVTIKEVGCDHDDTS